MPDHPGRETEQAHAQGMNQTDENVHNTHDEMTERDPATGGEQAPEQGETTKSQMSDVTIAVSVCLREPVVANDECGPTPSEPPTLTGPVETQSVPPAAGAVMEAAAQQAAVPAPARMDSKAQQVSAAVEQGKDGKASSGDGRPGLMVAGLVPTGDPAIPTTMSDTQVSAGDATLASLPASHGETGIQNQPIRISAGSSLPVETQASQNLRGGTEGSQQGDHAVVGMMGENRDSVQWAQPGSAEDQATGERGNRPAPPPAGSSGPSHVQLHGESGFGETVAAMAAERSPSTDGGPSRTTASSLAGRVAAPSWSTGDESIPMMQAVSLNLEPADLGPVNVRIFMMDRTVHAHIRTDHMDLGQGMLSQQQQLEVKLQSSGLEMGEFKVTVDQQQLSRGDSQGWLRHQGEGRPVPADSHQRVPAGDAREPLASERRRHAGIVSLFA